MTDEVRDGGMNLLGKVDAWDNLIRIKSESVAQELMGMILKEFCDNDLTSSGSLGRYILILVTLFKSVSCSMLQSII